MPWPELERPNQEHLKELRSFFSTAEKMAEWGGPGMRFPSTQREFEADLKLDRLDSYVLLLGSQLAGFGQFYERLEHCHLGRLVIAPAYRGQGLVQTLVEALLGKAQQKLGLARASLFVLEHNSIAIRAYQRLGFEESLYPEEMPLADCLYLTKSLTH